MRRVPAPGQRVRVTGVMPNDPCPMEVGAEGIVVSVEPPFGLNPRQIDVKWDNGRTLFLLDCDPFEVIA